MPKPRNTGSGFGTLHGPDFVGSVAPTNLVDDHSRYTSEREGTECSEPTLSVV
jgi:hypothetical protein